MLNVTVCKINFFTLHLDFTELKIMLTLETQNV